MDFMVIYYSLQIISPLTKMAVTWPKIASSFVSQDQYGNDVVEVKSRNISLDDNIEL